MKTQKVTKIKNELKFFIEDANFYTLWKYSIPAYREVPFTLSNISPLPKQRHGNVFDFLEARLVMSKVKFKNIGIYYQDLKEHLGGTILSEKKKKDYNAKDLEKAEKGLNNLVEGVGNSSDIQNLRRTIWDIYDWAYFEPILKKEEMVHLSKQLDDYVDNFLNKELFVYNKNYLLFEEQKNYLFGKIEKMGAIDKYGANFIISDTQSDNGFLFIHTLYAMQKLKYLGILRLWHETEDYNTTKITFFANVVVFDPLIDEVNSRFKEINPSLVYEGYDDTHKSIGFAGKKIELSKGGRETDPVLLIKTLSKEPTRYWFEDEILEDWGYREKDEAKKNKVYFAAKKVNQIIKEIIKIEDFLDHSTAKFRINPKYLKVDK